MGGWGGGETEDRREWCRGEKERVKRRGQGREPARDKGLENDNE